MTHTKPEENKVTINNPYRFWKDKKLSHWLNYSGIAACVIDLLVDVLAGISERVNDHVYGDAMSLELMTFYNIMLYGTPTVVPLGLYIKRSCSNTLDEKSDTKELLDLVNNDNNITVFIASNNESGNRIRAMSKKLEEYEQDNEPSLLDVIYNIAYLDTRTILRFLTMIINYNLADENTNEKMDDTSKWINISLSIMYVLYYGYSMYQAHKAKNSHSNPNNETANAEAKDNDHQQDMSYRRMT